MRRFTVSAFAVFNLWIGLAAILVPGGGISAQAVRGLSPVSIIRTGRFDIHFSEAMATQAQRLAGFADSMLADLEAFFGFSHPERRIPVLLTDREPSLNGYSTTYPSNRIVLFLARPTAPDELATISDELRIVFLHELVHSISMNSRGPLFGAGRWVFGDFLTPAAWIMPKSLVEGTSVWFESGVLPGAGRLADPSALENIALDLEAGRLRDLWDVSGLLDYSGSRSLPYLYGGLFVEYLAERFGDDIVSRLWNLAGKGNIFRGFDGTWTSRGSLEILTGEKPDAIWSEFLAWSAARLKSDPASASRDSGEELFPGAGSSGAAWIGALAVGKPAAPAGGAVPGGAVPGGTDQGGADPGGETLFYFDRERQAVYALPLGQATRARRLFPADSSLEAMRVSPDGSVLELDWYREDASGALEPARFEWNFSRGRLAYAGARPVPDIGLDEPFLMLPWEDSGSGWTYGLLAVGSSIVVVRKNREGMFERLSTPGLSPRTIAGIPGPEGPSLVLGGLVVTDAPKVGLPSSVRESGISRLAILRGDGDGWTLGVQKESPLGGAHRAVISSGGTVFYTSRGENGAERLRSLDSACLDPDSGKFAADFAIVKATFEPLDTGAAGGVPQPAAGVSQPAAKALFPQAAATSRSIAIDTGSVGLEFIGADLTERLVWRAIAGWNYLLGLPEESFAVSLSVDRHRLGVSLMDIPADLSVSSDPSDPSDPGDPGDPGSAARIFGVAGLHSYSAALGPSRLRANTSLLVSYSSIGLDYSLPDFFIPTSDYRSLGMDFEAGISSYYQDLRPPYDRIGFSSVAGFQAETLPDTVSALSASARIELSPRSPLPSLSLVGAWTPSGRLGFSPSGRLFTAGNDVLPSGLGAPYPEFAEYSRVASESPWYVAASIEERLFSIETAKAVGIVRMPFLPSWTLRRLVGRGGLRAAAFAPDRSNPAGIVIPAAAYARLELDAALLYGTAATGHFKLYGEFSWALDSTLVSGGRLHFDFGLDAELQ